MREPPLLNVEIREPNMIIMVFYFPAGLTIYVRYRQTDQALHQTLTSDHAFRSNVAALIIGELAAFGVSMVGNFQVSIFFPSWHYLFEFLSLRRLEARIRK